MRNDVASDWYAPHSDMAEWAWLASRTPEQKHAVGFLLRAIQFISCPSPLLLDAEMLQASRPLPLPVHLFFSRAIEANMIIFNIGSVADKHHKQDITSFGSKVAMLSATCSAAKWMLVGSGN